MSVCNIDNIKAGEENSISDPRLGCVSDANETCVTCHMRKECPGHFGHIELNEPVIHPMLYKTVIKILRCFCKKCHRFIFKQEDMEISGLDKVKGAKRFDKIMLKKLDTCAHCQSAQPKLIFKSKEMVIEMELKQKKSEDKKEEKKKNLKVVMDVQQIKEIFDNISDSDVRLMGLDPVMIHPRNLIITVLPVIPPCSRPFVVSDGVICDDDLTQQLMEIVKLNTALGTELKQETRNQKIQNLKFRIQTMFNNSNGKAKHPTDSRPLKGIKERLAGKDGRIRHNLMGKRVDFSARTVIGADPHLRLGQVGIPEKIAEIHTVPVEVTPFNIRELTAIVNEGKANFITTTKIVDGKPVKKRTNLSYAMRRKGTVLLVGDIIIRPYKGCPLFEQGNIEVDEKNFKQIKEIDASNLNINMKERDILIRGGKKEIVKKDGKKIMIVSGGHIVKNPLLKSGAILEIGQVVERQLRNGDPVLFNRQPSLHKGSMMTHTAVIGNHKSLRFNLAATKSYNADYDYAVINRRP
jgi:DNA-directed RNA polymerase beta' subunit